MRVTLKVYLKKIFDFIKDEVYFFINSQLKYLISRLREKYKKGINDQSKR